MTTLYPKTITGWLVFAVRTLVVSAWFFTTCFILGLLSCLRPFHYTNGTRFARWVCPVALRLMGIQWRFDNRDFLLRNCPAILVGNHQHMVDLFAYGTAMPDKFITLGKKELKWIPFFGWLYWLSGQMLVDRGNNARAVAKMKQAEAVLKAQGLSVLIFPEGTRSRGRPMGPFKKGAFRLALDTGLPLLPIATSSYFTTLNLGRVYAGPVLMKAMPPIPVTGKTVKDIESLMEETRRSILAGVAELDAKLAAAKKLKDRLCLP